MQLVDRVRGAVTGIVDSWSGPSARPSVGSEVAPSVARRPRGFPGQRRLEYLQVPSPSMNP